MRLSTLLSNSGIDRVDFSQAHLTGDEEIQSIASDSRQVTDGCLFIAVAGLTADGHDFIDQAFDKGAIAVVAQKNPMNRHRVILVANSRRTMSALAAGFYGHPSKDLTVLGITGTNGKTTTSFIMESIFKAAGLSTGVIGTVNIRYNGRTIDNPGTTPDSIDLQKTLHEMKQAGVTHVAMEVSSHGLDLHRVDDCRFDAGIFTNLTQDHLDYHKDMGDYFDCKKRFFTHLLHNDQDKAAAPAIINIDDSYGKRLSDALSTPVMTISTRNSADLTAFDIIDDINGLTASVRHSNGSFVIKSELTGTFNLENLLCAAGAALALDIDLPAILTGIEHCRVIPGRLEKIDNTIGSYLFVDYAHTPDALESILAALKQRSPGRVICVFGCGGDRDRTKRPQMGQKALEYSDIALITSDNPRTEDPGLIIQDIIDGLDNFEQIKQDTLLKDPQATGYMVEADRKKALEKAVRLARPGDIVVAAGKGHETYQITNSGTISFDDRLELANAAQKKADSFVPIPWTVSDLEEALGCHNVLGLEKKSLTFSGVSTDSRTIETTQAFLALRGDRFDGHDFIPDLIEKNIAAFIVDSAYWQALTREDREIFAQKQISFFVSDDTLTALGLLGTYQRERAGVKVLAITGSSGKTTTRRICEYIFSTRYHTHATSGNLNNEIGVPLTLLQLSGAHEWAVVEMGMNHQGEIARLTRIARPDIAVVLNTAGVHLEGLGSVENVARAKAEIFEGVKKGGCAILPADDPRRAIIEENARKNNDIDCFLFFGDHTSADLGTVDIQSSDNQTQFTVSVDGAPHMFSINSPGRFMVNNCLAAILAARTADIDIPQIRSGLNRFSPVKGRMTIYPLNDRITLMDDTYNANPASVSAALDTLAAVSKEHHSIAVLGDMLELGSDSDRLHWEIGQKAANSGINHLFVFGEQVRYLIEGALEQGLPLEHIFHGDKEQIARQILTTGDTRTFVLVKGSRGMAMETVIKKLKQLALTAAKGRK